MVDIHIRAALPDDIEGIYAVFCLVEGLHREAHPEIFKKADDPDDIKDTLLTNILSEDAVLYVAESGTKIIGIAIAWIRQTRDISLLVPLTYINVSDLVVAESSRKQGVGRALMNRIHLWASERGIKHIELTVWEFNRSAQDFYRQLGYKMLHHRMYKDLS